MLQTGKHLFTISFTIFKLYKITENKLKTKNTDCSKLHIQMHALKFRRSLLLKTLLRNCFAINIPISQQTMLREQFRQHIPEKQV